MFTPSLQFQQLTGAKKVQIGQSSISHLHKSHAEKWRYQKIAKIKPLNTEKKNNEELEENSLQSQLKRLQKQHFTGRVDIDVCGQTWKLYLSLGRLAWASEGVHERRRWRRQLIRANIAREIKTKQSDRFECRDYGLLNALSAQKLINKEQQIAIVRGVVTEILFDILQAIEVADTRQSKERSQAESDNVFTLIPRLGVRPSHSDTGILPREWTLEIELSLTIVEKAWEAWKKFGLARCSPNLAPILNDRDILQEQVSLKTYHRLLEVANGKRTLRDIAILMKKDLLGLTKYLLPYFRSKAIALVEIEDSGQAVAGDRVERKNRGLILCVDDSERIRHAMENLLTDAGYRVITIGEAVQAVPTLLQCQPEAIFLDLMMPIANGYEICTQIRRITQFKDTPILFLTGNNGLVDRVRAKMVGATDFLAKPVDRERVLATVEKYVKNPH
ncbi:MAG: response regulator [Cyanobacteria bacterium SBLK]|nr:response regulator [Cyanobacteria bacterium SBLK]